MLSHQKKKYFSVWTKMLPRESAQQSWGGAEHIGHESQCPEQAAVEGMCWDLQFQGTADGHQDTAISSVTLSPSLLFCEPPHLSQLHPVAAVHVCLCSRSQGPQEAPWVGRDLSCCPSTVAGDSHSAICVSEKQLRCILKTQGWNFLLPVVRWQVLLCWITTFPIFLSWLIIPCV